MKKPLLTLLTITYATISLSNVDDPSYFQCWEEESYAEQTGFEQEFKGKLFEQFNQFVECVNNKTGTCHKGFILYGKPGNGKSTIATDFAKKVKAYTLRVTGSIEGPYTGTSTERIDRLFEHARNLAQYNPVVIIIDEIDTLLRSTNNTHDSHSDQKADTAGHFLRRLDALPLDNSITVIGTTNFIKSLDTRISRNERFADFEIQNPDDNDRTQILKHYLSNYNLQVSENTLKNMVKKTNGFCSADLKQLVKEIVNNKSKQSNDDTLIKNELDKAIKNHVKYTARVSEEAARRRKQEKLIETQLENNKLQKMLLWGGIGLATGGAAVATAIYLPVIWPVVATKIGIAGASTTAAATTTTTGTAATVSVGAAAATGSTIAVDAAVTAAKASLIAAEAAKRNSESAAIALKVSAGGTIASGVFMGVAAAREKFDKKDEDEN